MSIKSMPRDNLTIIPKEILAMVAEALPISNALNLVCLNSITHNNRTEILSSVRYEDLFGKIKKDSKSIDKKIEHNLICLAEKQPNIAKNYNNHRAPTGRLERWKWLAGVENKLDKDVQENYNKSIELLEHTQSGSIVQLKNKLLCFWHLDREVKDYGDFKKKLQPTNKIAQFLFACLRFVFRLCYKPSEVSIGKDITLRSQKTVAKIGHFVLNGQGYDVVALHTIGDETNVEMDVDEVDLQFRSVSRGKTRIVILKENTPAVRIREKHNFGILIGRKQKDTPLSGIASMSSEDSVFHGNQIVLDKDRHLVVHSDLAYKDSTEDAHGSDRLLDQKLTQIMVEMTMQNREIQSLLVESNHDDFAVLTAGGFSAWSEITKHTLTSLEEFRLQQEDNKLFPPYKDYNGIPTKFEPKTYKEKNVYFSKEAPESWSDIIARTPILTPGAGVLPEYWAKKPKLDTDS